MTKEKNKSRFTLPMLSEYFSSSYFAGTTSISRHERILQGLHGYSESKSQQFYHKTRHDHLSPMSPRSARALILREQQVFPATNESYRVYIGTRSLKANNYAY